MPIEPHQKTHRAVKNPTISARDLADFMVAGARRRRSIVQDCKFRPKVRLVQHSHARTAVSRYLCEPQLGAAWLAARADQLRDAIADDDFDRSLFDNNADYIDRFAEVCDKVVLPKADVVAKAITKEFDLNGVAVGPQIRFQFSRVTKTNKVRIGACALRYAKGKPLAENAGEWQAALMFGYLAGANDPNERQPEHKLCIVVDAFSGKVIASPTDAVTRYNELAATCATIAEWWPNIEPPPGATY